MSRDYGKISTSIWNSRKFGEITDDARLLYLYLHTCPHVNSVGCFVLKDGYATADLNWNTARYLKAINSLSKAYLIAIDRRENLIRLVNFLKFDPFTNPKHAQGAIKLAIALPDSVEKLNVLSDIVQCKHADESEPLHVEIDSLSKAYRNPEPEPEPEPEFTSFTTPAIPEKPKPATPKRATQFKADWMPNEKAVEFCLSKGYDHEQVGQLVEDCVNFHIGKGNTFKDHNAALRTWASNQIKFHGEPDQQRKRGNSNGNGNNDNGTLDLIAQAARIGKA